MSELGRTLISLGLGLVALGGLVLLVGRFGGLPFGLGKLPGDFLVKRDGFTFYFPLMSSILVSVVLSALLYLFRR